MSISEWLLDFRKRLKDSQSVLVVLLFAVLAVYTVLGALLFLYLEQEKERKNLEIVFHHRSEFFDWLYDGFISKNRTFQNISREKFHELTVKELEEYVDFSFEHLQPGALAHGHKPMWNFGGSLLFCTSILSTIGFGFAVPMTQIGRLAMYLYGAVGIPLFFLILQKIGSALYDAFLVMEIKFRKLVHRFLYHNKVSPLGDDGLPARKSQPTMTVEWPAGSVLPDGSTRTRSHSVSVTLPVPSPCSTRRSSLSSGMHDQSRRVSFSDKSKAPSTSGATFQPSVLEYLTALSQGKKGDKLESASNVSNSNTASPSGSFTRAIVEYVAPSASKESSGRSEPVASASGVVPIPPTPESPVEASHSNTSLQSKAPGSPKSVVHLQNLQPHKPDVIIQIEDDTEEDKHLYTPSPHQTHQTHKPDVIIQIEDDTEEDNLYRPSTSYECDDGYHQQARNRDQSANVPPVTQDEAAIEKHCQEDQYEGKECEVEEKDGNQDDGEDGDGFNQVAVMEQNINQNAASSAQHTPSLSVDESTGSDASAQRDSHAELFHDLAKASSSGPLQDYSRVSVTLIIMVLLMYMAVGSLMLMWLEDWSLSDSFYFVFSCLTTIGFSDVEPKLGSDLQYFLPITLFIVIGLAIESMLISAMQFAVYKTYEKASIKAGKASQRIAKSLHNVRSKVSQKIRTKGDHKKRSIWRMVKGKKEEDPCPHTEG